jgi:prepilin-type N-terminal cleavage/methylation domain-containing protein/prepilin-type processing-associated H-X9-DG protein
MRRNGFTVVELLAAVAIIGVLAMLVTATALDMIRSASTATSANIIRQLTAGGVRYLAEHDNTFWKYREDDATGTKWWWGYETYASQGSGEGNRTYDPQRSPLGGYIAATPRPDPSFGADGGAFKPKYKSGYIGIGYNVLLGGGFWSSPKNPAKPLRYWQLSNPAKVVVFATCAQVYPFSKSSKPMIEEFYGISERELTVHFRHAGQAMVGFADGSAGFLPMDESTRDNRAPKANIGRFAPVGSKKYLQ